MEFINGLYSSRAAINHLFSIIKNFMKLGISLKITLFNNTEPAVQLTALDVSKFLVL